MKTQLPTQEELRRDIVNTLKNMALDYSEIHQLFPYGPYTTDAVESLKGDQTIKLQTFSGKAGYYVQY